jgi:hypothetical protein
VRALPLGLAKETEPCGSSHYPHVLKGRSVGNQAALVVKISVRLNMQRKVYSWEGARRCTICDNVIVRSARRRTEKKRVATAWLTHHAAAGRFSPLRPQAHLLVDVWVAKYKSGGDRSLKQTAAMWLPRVTVKRGWNS